jgi:hypothetical protein
MIAVRNQTIKDMDIRSATISAGFGFLGSLLKSYSENLRRRKTSPYVY